MKDFLTFRNNGYFSFISGNKSDWFPEARGFTVDLPCSLSFIMASLRSKKWCKLKSLETNPLTFEEQLNLETLKVSRKKNLPQVHLF